MAVLPPSFLGTNMASDFKVCKAKNPKESSEMYDEWAGEYDKDLLEKSKYTGAQHVAAVVRKHLPDTNAKILDFGAGTGLVAEHLTKYGFTNIDAYDGSKRMLEIARQKGIYKNLYQEICEPGQPAKNVPVAAYDAVVTSGCIAPGHLHSDHLPFFLSYTKKGGKILIEMRAQFLKYETAKEVDPSWKYNIEEKMEIMEKECQWKLIEKVLNEHYVFGSKEGFCFVFEKN